MKNDKMIKFQMLRNELNTLEQRERMLIQGMEDLERTKVALEEISGHKGKAFIPLGANNFVLGTIEDPENVLIAIGSGIAVKRSRKDALKINNDRLEEFSKEAEKTISEMKRLTSQLSRLQAELQPLMK